MTELTDLSDTDATNTAVSGQSTQGNVANMGGMDNLQQAILGMLSRFRNANIFRLRDNSDNTKLLAFGLSGITTATTRTLTVPDASGTLPILGLAQTWTAAQTFPTNTAVNDATAATLNLTISGSVRAFLSYTEATALARLDSDGSIVFAPNNTDAGRFTPAGKFLVGTGTEGTAKVLVTHNNTTIRAETTLSGAIIYDTNYNVASGTATFLQCRYNGSAVGSISCADGVNTAYNTTSDYRVKDKPQPISGFSERIDALLPSAWTWASVGSEGRGFIAHEFAEVYPASVTGEKDAVNEDGTPDLQSMQASTSEVMADIIAELQSLRRRVAELEAQP